MFGMDPQFSVHVPTVAISVAIGVTVVILSSLPALFRSLRVSVVEGMESHGISANYGNSVIDKLLMKVQGVPRVTQMGIRNAIRRKGRSISTALQIAFAVGIVLSMLAFGDTLISVTVGAYEDEKQDLSAFVEYEPNNPLTADKGNFLEEIKGVKSTEPFIRTSAKINDRSVPAYRRSRPMTGQVPADLRRAEADLDDLVGGVVVVSDGRQANVLFVFPPFLAVPHEAIVLSAFDFSSGRVEGRAPREVGLGVPVPLVSLV